MICCVQHFVYNMNGIYCLMVEHFIGHKVYALDEIISWTDPPQVANAMVEPCHTQRGGGHS